MTERDNFNLAKFIRNNQLLNESFEGFGGYRDLKPLKEDDQVENETEDLGGWDDGDDPQYDGEVGENPLEADIAKFIAHIKPPHGEGTIGLDYVRDTWESLELNTPFDSAQKEIIAALDAAGVLNLNYDDEMNEVTYVTDDSEDEKGFVVPGNDSYPKGGFTFDDFDETDLNGSSTEQAIDNLISEFEQIIKSQIPNQLQYSARIAVKKLWASKLRDWKSNM